MWTLIHLETGIQEEIVSQGSGAKMYPQIMMGTSSNSYVYLQKLNLSTPCFCFHFFLYPNLTHPFFISVSVSMLRGHLPEIGKDPHLLRCRGDLLSTQQTDLFYFLNPFKEAFSQSYP